MLSFVSCDTALELNCHTSSLEVFPRVFPLTSFLTCLPLSALSGHDPLLFTSLPKLSPIAPPPPPPPHTHIHPYSLCSSHKRENRNRRPIYKSSWTTCHFQQQHQKSGISILRMCCVVPLIFNLTVSHFQVTFEPHITDMYLTTLP